MSQISLLCQNDMLLVRATMANWHIMDSVHGAEASAIVCSLVGTTKANELKIYEYLKHLLTEIPKYMDDASLTFLYDLLHWSENLPEQ